MRRKSSGIIAVFAIALGVAVAAASGLHRVLLHTPRHSLPLVVLLETAVAAGASVAFVLGFKASRVHWLEPGVLATMMIAYVIASRDAAVAAAVIGLAIPACCFLAGSVAGLQIRGLQEKARTWISLLLYSLLGLHITIHVLLVAKGSGIVRSETWGYAYFLVATVIASRLHRFESPHRSQPFVQALTVENAVVSFGDNHVLRGATMGCSSGEMIALAGANGSGKSTLLRVASGFLKGPAVFVNGHDASFDDPEQRSARGLSYISGANPVFAELTVEENLRVGAGSLRAFRARTHEVLKSFPVFEDKLGTPAGVLSGGEQRLLAIAQTMYARPLVLLADELTAGLDPGASRVVLERLRAMANDECAVIVVDHDLQALLSICDRALLLREGQITTYDDPAALLHAHAELLPARFLARS